MISTLGTVLRGIREARGIPLNDMANALSVKPLHLARLESDKVRLTKRQSEFYLAMPLTKTERHDLNHLYVDWSTSHEAIPCKDCGGHDGEMRPGGPTGTRDEHCSNCSSCLTTFVWRWGLAQRCHCPPNCTKRVHEEREQLISIGSTLHAVR
jgi:hypothetical protein